VCLCLCLCVGVCAPAGSGKSAVLQRVLDTLADKYAFPGFLVVRLNGLVHTTDVLAVREIARQLYLLDHVNAESVLLPVCVCVCVCVCLCVCVCVCVWCVCACVYV